MPRRSLSGLLDAERLFADLISTNIGLAILDQQLHYQALNPFLAASNGTSVEAHLGKHVREILGDVALQVEPAIERVFAIARPVLNCEVAGALPTKPVAGHWMGNFFPIVDSNGNVIQVGAVVVELSPNVLLHPPSNVKLGGTVLRSWKDIARYVGTCVKTLQRWENAYHFPVRRLNPNKGSVVFALKEDVDQWFHSMARSPASIGIDKRISVALPKHIVRFDRQIHG